MLWACDPMILWACGPSETPCPSRCVNPTARAFALRAEALAICRLGLPGWPCLGRGAPHWPPGYRGSEISSAPRTLYLSQASAVGMDGPGLAQGRGELFYISHTAKRGFGILVTAHWDMGCRWEFCEVLHASVRVWLYFRMFEVELKWRLES